MLRADRLLGASGLVSTAAIGGDTDSTIARDVVSERIVDALAVTGRACQCESDEY
jgi:hypothetical protein